MSIVVTGSAGYIGSHLCHAIRQRDKTAVLWELDMKASHRPVQGTEVILNLLDNPKTDQFFEENLPQTVIHCAGEISPFRAEEDPIRCFRHNVQATLNVLEAAVKSKVKNFIFLSSAAVYGPTVHGPIQECSNLQPTNNYARTKVWCEEMVQSICKANPTMNYGIIRCFMVVGRNLSSDWLQVSSEHFDPIRIAAQVVTGSRDRFTIFGNTFQTIDGTCVRDYIHIRDLSELTFQTIDHLEHTGENLVLNGATGTSTSIQQIVTEMSQLSDGKYPHTIEPPLPNEYPCLLADMTRVRETFGWKPRFSNLNDLCKEAVEFERKVADV